MKNSNISHNNFDSKFNKILKQKRGRNIVRSNFDIENISIDKKIDFIIHRITEFEFRNIIYKIIFWDDNNRINDFLNNKYDFDHIIVSKQYKNGATPGVIFIEDTKINILFLRKILLLHFNFEFAKIPCINMKLQIFLKLIDNNDILIDIYDDRGFNIYFLNPLFSPQM